MKRLIASACLIALVIASDASFLEAVDVEGSKQHALKKSTNAAGLPVRTKMTINQISSWYDSDATEEINSATGNSGVTYPVGTTTAIFAAGLMWTGDVNDGATPIIRTNGHSYNTGLIRGAILGQRTGQIEDPDAPDVRIWRIRRDYATADLRRDAAEINDIGLANVSDAQIAAARAQYEKDWLEWPAQKGAPFYDADSDGVYSPQIVSGAPVLFPDADEPGIADGDQVLWYAANDIGKSTPWGATTPFGMEFQLAVWGYARTDALGHVLFKKYRLIYKGTASTPATANITNMYMAQWSDPDLGQYADDFAGCDTVLSLGFIYNGGPVDVNYAAFGLAPAAMGYDFLQGPLVPGVAGEDKNKNGIDDGVDTGIFDLERTPPGFINLPMTAFIYFAAGGRYSDPPFSYAGALQWNCMLKGGPPTPQPPPCPAPPDDPFLGGPAGHFWLWAGSDGTSSPNPDQPNGWVDGMVEGPGDRRIILASGPFTMALGDTQELVSALVGGLGTTRLKSIQVLKFRDKSVQLAYDNLFDLPKAPANPDVDVVALDKAIILDWESNPAAVQATEVPVYQGGYAFEGYKIYQLPTASSSLEEAELLGSYDIVNGVRAIFQDTFDPETGEILNLPVQLGADNGIQRTFTITRDAVRSAPLVNGTAYYFAVTAYNYTPQNQPIKALESSPIVITAVPAEPDPGTRYPYGLADTVQTVENSIGINDATVTPVVFDPTRPKGQVYDLRFDSLATGFAWSLMNNATSDTLFMNIPVDSTAVGGFRLLESGVTLTVVPPPVGVKTITDASGADVFGGLLVAESDDVNSLAGGGRNTGRTYELRFQADSTFVISVSPPIFSRAIKVPFSVWDLGRGPEDTPRQVMAAVKDTLSTAPAWNIWPASVDDASVFEPLYISTITYVPDDPGTPVREDSSAVKAQQFNLINVVNLKTNVNNAIHRAFVADLDGDGVAPSPGTSVFFNRFLELRTGDTKKVTLNSVISGDVEIARDDVTRINVFPNPYYGLNTRETSSEVRFVTFNHLPARAVIRIFNLAGVLVRTLVKDENTTNPTSPQHFTWNLQNDNGLPVASGIYIVYMELKDAAGNDLGIKTLKLALIQEQQFLRNY
jgi:hypothetical protein